MSAAQLLSVMLLLAAASALPACAPALESTATSDSPGSQAGVGLAVGLHAPAFSVAGLDGRTVTDADFRAVDRPYILYFYATW